MPSSIKTKIIILYISVMFTVLSVLGMFLYISIGKIIYDSIDSSLLSRAKALATLINENANDSNGATEFKFSDDIMWEYSSPNARSFFQIRRQDGTIVEKSESLKDLELPFHEEKNNIGFESILLNGTPLRLVNFHVEGRDGAGKEHASENGGLIVQCAEDIRDRISLLNNYRVVLASAIIFIMIISVSGGFLLAGKALSPVKGISDTIDRISESNLSERIKTENVSGELKGLASSFNRTFDRLDKAFKRQRQFSADASHELKVPLSVILSHSEIMLRKERTLGEYKDAFTAVMEAAKMMSEIVRKLLASARLSDDRLDLKIENINPVEVIRNAVALLTPLAVRTGVDINAPADEDVMVPGDHAMLLELFVNIIDNAIKYNVPHGRVDISVKRESDFIVAEINDTGVGIPEKDLDRVFDRFYRVDKSRSKETGGAGLGLSIADCIAKLHGGRIDIKSRPGAGTTVSVYLKRVADAAQA
ncbi:MAG: sensor histidine kinase N-terminal domain-containing protein [Deltaproteobacteria bacterium]|nr:sensor histidine kinase N-terminal domain-containing protein [Deltaproteobacteria bacterium]